MTSFFDWDVESVRPVLGLGSKIIKITGGRFGPFLVDSFYYLSWRVVLYD